MAQRLSWRRRLPGRGNAPGRRAQRVIVRESLIRPDQMRIVPLRLPRQLPGNRQALAVQPRGIGIFLQSPCNGQETSKLLPAYKAHKVFLSRILGVQLLETP